MLRASRLLAIASLAWFTVALATNSAAQCTTGGLGGAIPVSGTGNGTWDTALPTAPLIRTLSVSVPAGASVLNSVVLHSLSHTYIGDLQFVLANPSGASFDLIHRPGFTGAGLGDSGDYGGTYTIVDSGQLSPCGPPRIQSGGGVLPSGTYVQEFGAWTSGTLGIANTPLESIPIASGTWTLKVYDWAAGDTGALASWDLCFGSPTPPPVQPPMTCVSGGASGAFPASGAVDGSWPSTLPTGAAIAPLAVTLPAGASKIVAVRIDGLAHTWAGDAQLVLQDPAGHEFNLFQNHNGPSTSGCSDDFAGNYAFVDANVGLDPCSAAAAPNFACGGSGTVPPGFYRQEFGTWPSGSAGIANTPLASIPIVPGTWNLIAYDWHVASDSGAFAAWELCFDTTSGPVSFCTPNAPGTSHGCIPTMSANGNPNVAQSNTCVITAADVEGQKTGIIFYGLATVGFPWCSGGNSTLCVKSPTQRTPLQLSGGTPNSCNGSLALDWNLFQNAHPGALGNPWSAGTHAYVQGWLRDPPSCKTTFLSEALDLTYVP